MCTDFLVRMLRMPLMAFAAVLALAFSAVSCDLSDVEPDKPVLSFGKSGDGLSLAFNSRDIFSPAGEAEKEIRFTMGGYIPEDLKLEVFGHGMDVVLIERTSVTEGLLTVKPSSEEGEHRVSILAYNGSDLLRKNLYFSGAAIYQDDIVRYDLGFEAGHIDLDWFEGEEYYVTVSDGASSWITADGLGVNVSQNDGDPREASLSVSFTRIPTPSSCITYTISQTSGLERLLALKYEEDFKYFQSIGSDRKVSSITPLGTHFEKYPAASEEQKKWLSTASNEPMALPAHPEWPYTSFPNIKLYPFGHPSPADVNQHGIGDCCFLAVLADFAYMYPGFIEDIITRRDDDTYDVKMFDPRGNRITVSVTSKFLTGDGGGVQQVTARNSKPSWSTVMEKALLKWETVFGVDKLGGIGPGAAAAPFTGNGDGFGFGHNVLSAGDLVRAVEAGLYKRHFITGGFKYADYLVGTAKTVTSHCYSIFYTPVEGAMFTMRNPWGFCNGGTVRGDGCMDIVDDGIIPPIIDIRIMEPGAAEEFAVKDLLPYEKPF